VTKAVAQINAAPHGRTEAARSGFPAPPAHVALPLPDSVDGTGRPTWDAERDMSSRTRERAGEHPPAPAPALSTQRGGGHSARMWRAETALPHGTVVSAPQLGIAPV